MTSADAKQVQKIDVSIFCSCLAFCSLACLLRARAREQKAKQEQKINTSEGSPDDCE